MAYRRSKALESLDDRMKDIDLLLESHELVSKVKKAEKDLQSASGLAEGIKALAVIVGKPVRGRPPALGALNRAAVVLLSAHLQGYFEEVYEEAADFLLESKVKNLDVLKERGRSGFGNPHSWLVDSLFASLGLPDMTDGIRWSSCPNKKVKGRLRGYIELRNKIAHGEEVTVWKLHVNIIRDFVERFASRFDEKLFTEMHGVAGREPW